MGGQHHSFVVNWSREFFCENWVSPSQKYQVVSKDGSCYIDAASPSPAPSPAPSPSPTPSGQGIANQKNGLCLSTSDQPHNGAAVTVEACGDSNSGWTYDD